MTAHREPCCSSPASIWYWFLVSLAAWGLLSFIGAYWHPLRALSAETIFVAMAIGCVANWLRNRTLHCGITAPLFLLLAVLSLLADLQVVHTSSAVIWALALAAVAISFLLEWRYGKQSAL